MNTSKIFSKTLVLLCLVIVIVGCAIKPKPIERMDKIKVGMEEDDVRNIMDLPDFWLSSEDEEEEIWQYCITERFKPVNDVVVVWFLERKVTGVETYSSVGFGGCAMFFRNIKWENAPHRKKTQ